MLHCIIIEDQPPAQRILKKFIEDVGTLSLKGVFSDALQAMEYMKTERVDLLFLDIHLPKISGIDFLKTMHNPPHVILTTAFSEYALEGYDLNVVDYLLKPFSFQRFVKAVAKVQVKRKQGQKEAADSGERPGRKEIFIKSGYEHIKIYIDDIIYIKSDADYTEIVTPEKKYLSPEPLRFWEENLNNKQFVRTHKSFIASISKIEKIIGNQIYLIDKLKIPIGRAYKDSFMKNVLK